MRHLGGALVGLLLASQANAGFLSSFDPNVRVGFGGGPISIAGNNHHLADFSLTTGYEFNRYFSAELSWLGGADSLVSTKAIAGGTQVDSVGNHYWNVSVIGGWPYKEMIMPYGRLGMLNYGGNSVKTTGAGVTRSDLSGNSLIYGIGAAIMIDNGMLRLEYDRSKIVDKTVTYIGFSAVWKFALK
jgi:hypothetical protein